MARTELFARSQPGGVYTVANFSAHPGEIWFVNSATGADSVGYGRNPDAPLDSLAYAFSSGLLASGDVVYVMPGHAETLDSAADIDCNVAGVKVIGCGWGAIRPTFTFSTTADGTFAVGESSLWFENLLFVANFTNGVTAGVDIDGAHTDIMFRGCEWRATSATKEFLTAVTIAASGARVMFDGCLFTEGAGSATAAITTEGAHTDLVVSGCEFHGTYSAASIDISAGTNVVVTPKFYNNWSNNADTGAGLFVKMDSGTVGFFVGNRSGIGKANTVPVSDASASVFVDNKAVDAANLGSLEYPATATAWS